MGEPTLPNKTETENNLLKENILKARETSNNLRKGIDSLQKVIRGAIYFNSVFETSDLKKDFQNNFKPVLNQFSIDHKYLDTLENKFQDILICCLTLLHDATIRFYDKNTARVYLCSYYEYDAEYANKSHNEMQYQFGVLALYMTYEFNGRQNSYPVYVSEILTSQYVDIDDFNQEPIDSTIYEIPWITAKRINKELKLKKTYS